MPSNQEHPIQVLGRYAICDVLGAGGMATVHVGRLLGPVGFARTVAIKKMHAHLAKDPQFVAMFLEEAQIAARVQHANVVATLDVVSEEGQLFHVMEYVAGESLAKVLWVLSKSNARLPQNVAGTVVSQALHGLHAVHEVKGEDNRPLGLIHRDVSPDNILVGRDGNARVLDFGIAKATELGRKTKAGQIKGKIAYMSPEHMRGKDLDRRADIYAMGAVLFEALTGRRLVGGESDAEIIHQALTLQTKPPSAVVPSISKAIDDLVMRALSPDRERRFATAQEMALEVERVLGVASPATIGQLVESVVGKDLEKKAALVDSAVKRSSQLAPSTKGPDSAHVRRSTAETEAAMPTPFQAADAQSSTSVEGTHDAASRGSRMAAPEGGVQASGTNVMDVPDLLGGAGPAMALPSLPGLDAPLHVAPAAPAAPAQQAPVQQHQHMPAAGGLSLELDAPRPAVAHQPAPPPARPLPAPAPEPAAEGLGASLDIDFGPQAPPPRAHPPMGHAERPGPMAGGMGGPPLAPHYPMAGRAAGGGGTRGGASPALIVPIVAGALIIVAVALVVVFKRAPSSSSASAVTAPPPTQEEVASCDVLRKHLKKGGQPTGQSRAGWAVELWLRGKDGARIDASTIDKALLAPSASDVVEVTTLKVPTRSFEEGTLVRVRGPSTETAFDSEGALRLIKAADQAFVKTGAEVGALYLKCAHLPHHDVGLWFRAPDVKQAASSLLFSMGLFSEITVVRDELLETRDMRPDMTMFERIRAKIASKQPKTLDQDLQGYGGTVDEPEGGGVRVTFPTNHLGSAARASRVVADRAGIENL